MPNICYINKETIHVCCTKVQCTSEILYFSVKFYRASKSGSGHFAQETTMWLLVSLLPQRFWTPDVFAPFRGVNICVMLKGKKQTVFCTSSRELVNNSRERG